VVWNYSYVTEMAPGQKRHTSQARFSYAAEPRARVKYPPFLPIIAPRLRLLAIRPKQFYGLYGTAWPRAPPLILFDYFYGPSLPSVNLNFSLFLIDP